MPYPLLRPQLFAVAGAALLLLAACGQKGPLYLPGEGSDRVTEIPLPGDEEAAGEDDAPREDGQDESRR